MGKILFKTLGVPFHHPHVALTHFGPGQTSFQHAHDFFEVFLVMSGSGIHHINRKKVELSAGHMVVIQPEDCHHFSTRPKEGIAILNVAMASAWWESFHQLMGKSVPSNWHCLGQPPGHLLLSRPNQRNMQKVFEQLGAFRARPSTDTVEALARVIELFESHDQGALPQPPAWLEEWKWKIMEAGEEVAEPIHHWQKKSGHSVEHLARSCHRFYHRTPTDILNQARIERAKMLLGTTGEKVISIGLACGFWNLANFYRNFAARTGMTPKEWRQRGSATVPLTRNP